MVKKQQLAMFAALITVLLIGPTYVMFAIATAPFGVGMLALMQDSSWVLNFYPLMFAGEMHGRIPNFYLERVVSVPLTILEWLLISWIFSWAARKLSFRLMVMCVVALLLVVWALTSFALSIAGIAVVWTSART